MKRPGFTLIELLVVIAIVSFLSSVVMVNVTSIRNKARIAQAKSNARTIALAIELLYQDTERWPAHSNQVDSLCNTNPTLSPGDFSYQPFEITNCEVITGGYYLWPSGPHPSNSNLNLPEYGLTQIPGGSPILANYPGWHGPYLPNVLGKDPWGQHGYLFDPDYSLSVCSNDRTQLCSANAECSSNSCINYYWVAVVSYGPDKIAYTRDDIAIPLCEKPPLATQCTPTPQNIMNLH